MEAAKKPTKPVGSNPLPPKSAPIFLAVLAVSLGVIFSFANFKKKETEATPVSPPQQALSPATEPATPANESPTMASTPVLAPNPPKIKLHRGQFISGGSGEMGVNLDSQGEFEIVRSIPVSEYASRISVHDSRGKLLWEASEQPDSPGYYFDTIWTIADFDGDRKDEVISSHSNRGGPPSHFQTLDWDGSKMVRQYRGAFFQKAHNLTSLVNADTKEASRPRVTTGAYLAEIKGASDVRGRLVGVMQFSTDSAILALTRDAEIEPDGKGFRLTRWLSKWSVSPDENFLLPKSLVEPLTAKDLKGFSAKELTIIRNQIFAVHGRGFRDAELRAYFQSLPWYQPHFGYSDQKVSPIQNKNALFISQYQNRNGLVW